MAGEGLQTIRKTEEEAQDIINRAKSDVQSELEKARAQKKRFIEEKDVLLEKEETSIRQKYEREASTVLEDIAREEKEQIEKINSVCEKNLAKVVQYITEEIVKE